MRKISARFVCTQVSVVAAIVMCFAACRSLPLNVTSYIGKRARETLSQARLRVDYFTGQGKFKVTRLRNAIRLEDMTLFLHWNGKTFSSADAGSRSKVQKHDVLRMIVRTTTAEGLAWDTRFEIRIHPNMGNPKVDEILRDSYGVEIECTLVEAKGADPLHEFSISGLAKTRPTAFVCRLSSTKAATGMKTPALALESESTDTICDPKRSSLVHMRAGQAAIGLPQQRFRGLTYPFELRFQSSASIDFAEGECARLNPHDLVQAWLNSPNSTARKWPEGMFAQGPRRSIFVERNFLLASSFGL